MAQDLTVNIKTTSDVPQAMDKAKSATVSMGKQVEDVQKKFSTGFKDVFLAFTAPLVLFNAALNFIQGAIDKNRQQVADAIAFAEKGESKLLSAGDVALARQNAADDATEKEKKLAEEQKTASTEKYLEKGGAWGGNADSVISELWKRGQWVKAAGMYTGLEDMGSDKDVQEIVRQRALKGEAAKGMEATGTDLRKLEGLSNVIGVGANPVLEAMSAQLEQARLQTELLDQIASAYANGGTDFTKPAEPDLSFTGGF
jgi:hypothetical protein